MPKLRAVKAEDISTTYKPVEMKMSSAWSHHEGLDDPDNLAVFVGMRSKDVTPDLSLA